MEKKQHLNRNLLNSRTYKHDVMFILKRWQITQLITFWLIDWGLLTFLTCPYSVFFFNQFPIMHG